MRMVCFALLAPILASILVAPSLAWAESAHHEPAAHEAAEHEAGHDAHDGHGELTFKGLLSSPDFQGTLVNFGAMWEPSEKLGPLVFLSH